MTGIDDPGVFTSTRQACLAEANHNWPPQQVVPVVESEGRQVRPAGWTHFHTVLEVEPLDDEHVRVWWDSLNGRIPGDVQTVFRRDEWVIVR